ncbi:uncharacterized protein [Panulirus ornatus]|uniref:uncharacterized protein n=1 Tax=Panulirus ornatus TaxID=150431 RepID=UPI003A84BF92
MLVLVGSLVLALAATGPAQADTLPHLFLSSAASPSYKYSRYLPSTYSSSASQPKAVPLMMMKTARFVVVSEGQYDHAHHTRGRANHEPREPHFANGNTSRQVFLGNTVTLDCTVHDMTNESVSWMRSVGDMLELITWDSHTYAKDDRYSLVRESGDRWHRWELVIRRTRADDEGQYRCQVATQPPMVLVVNLNVTEPVARVVDERGTKVLEKHYNSGSMIELKCIIERVPFPHGAVTWRRDATTLTYNTSRGGISVKGDKSSGYLRSRLYVADATPSDSGVYSCWYKNFTSDTVTVHVIAGENSAAMQHDALPGSASSSSGGSSSGPQTHRSTSHTILSLLLLATSCFAATWVFSCPNAHLDAFSVWFTFSQRRGFNTFPRGYSVEPAVFTANQLVHRLAKCSETSS